MHTILPCEVLYSRHLRARKDMLIDRMAATFVGLWLDIGLTFK